jgi:hypothetical protein
MNLSNVGIHSNVDVRELFDKVNDEKIKIEQWPQWLTDQMIGNQAR